MIEAGHLVVLLVQEWEQLILRGASPARELASQRGFALATALICKRTVPWIAVAFMFCFAPPPFFFSYRLTPTLNPVQKKTLEIYSYSSSISKRQKNDQFKFEIFLIPPLHICGKKANVANVITKAASSPLVSLKVSPAEGTSPAPDFFSPHFLSA